jgi:N6-L-threonylcarbamoyladenine synthase
MKILAIETSCDDTALALVEIRNKKFKVLSNIVSSQTKIHEKWGGVFPSMAKREHLKNLPLIFKKIYRVPDSITFIAVTAGPGLEPCLWTGINFAKDLAKKLNLPIIPVNHIEAHILVNFMNKKPKLPAVALVVSGGHTQLILVKKIGKYKILGETRDDAAGECFDKTARILGLGYPGGPAIAKAADQKNPRAGLGTISLPRPMMHTKDYDFSFSGLKTAVLYETKKRKVNRKAMAKEIQQAIIDVLLKKTKKAALDYGAKTIIVGGGVSANEELRKQFKKNFPDVIFPEKNFSTDNAVMTAVAGYYNRNKKTKNYNRITARSNLRIGQNMLK